MYIGYFLFNCSSRSIMFQYAVNHYFSSRHWHQSHLILFFLSQFFYLVGYILLIILSALQNLRNVKMTQVQTSCVIQHHKCLQHKISQGIGLENVRSGLILLQRIRPVSLRQQYSVLNLHPFLTIQYLAPDREGKKMH